MELHRIKYKTDRYSWMLAWLRQYRQVMKWINNNEVDIVEAPDSRGWFAFVGKAKVPLVIRCQRN